MITGRRTKMPGREIGYFCRRWKVRELSVFGSVVAGGLRPESDIDVMVDFEPGAERSLFDMVSMTDELREIFGRDVDLLTRRAVEQSRNHIRRKAILSAMEVIYASWHVICSRHPDTCTGTCGSGARTGMEIIHLEKLQTPRGHHRAPAGSLFNRLNVLPLDRAGALRGARIVGELKRKGSPADVLDALVAGIFLAHGCDVVVTRNKKHFEHVKGLKVETY